MKKIKTKHSHWEVVDILSDVVKRSNGENVWFELSVRMKKGNNKRTEKLICSDFESVSKIKKGSKIKRDE